MGSVEGQEGFIEEMTSELGLEGSIEIQQDPIKGCLLYKYVTQFF